MPLRSLCLLEPFGFAPLLLIVGKAEVVPALPIRVAKDRQASGVDEEPRSILSGVERCDFGLVLGIRDKTYVCNEGC